MSRQIRILLRAEGALGLIVSLAAYAHLGGSWWLFVLCFLLPDLAMLGYLSGNARVGGMIYNLAHTYLAPGLLAGGGLLLREPLLVLLALIWTAHIGMDRAVGYGLKRPSGFRETHLGTMSGAARTD